MYSARSLKPGRYIDLAKAKRPCSWFVNSVFRFRLGSTSTKLFLPSSGELMAPNFGSAGGILLSYCGLNTV